MTFARRNSLGQMAMDNVGLVRQICGRISRETDESKIEQLLLLLNAVILNDPEEVHVRKEYIRRKYAIAFEASDL
jgi:hypothetical protein